MFFAAVDRRYCRIKWVCKTLLATGMVRASAGSGANVTHGCQLFPALHGCRTQSPARHPAPPI